ncbi:MAG: hypothetical protein KDI06_03715 [Calditrichaeota bacterium]|nr:hypothetical protein [Calditrichota bacterium]HQU74087.1 hypothetical protein [Calditrichia bacterium]
MYTFTLRAMEEHQLIQDIEVSLSRYSAMLGRLDSENLLEQVGHMIARLTEFLNIQMEIQDEVVNFRLKKIIKEERPYIPQIRQERLGNGHRPNLGQTAQRFLQQRRELLKLLNSLPREYWDRTGFHETEGHITFREFIRRMVDKDQQVLQQLSQLSGPKH